MDLLLQERRELEEKIELIDQILDLCKEDETEKYFVDICEVEEDYLSGWETVVQDEGGNVVYHTKTLVAEEFDTETLRAVLESELM